MNWRPFTESVRESGQQARVYPIDPVLRIFLLSFGLVFIVTAMAWLTIVWRDSRDKLALDAGVFLSFAVVGLLALGTAAVSATAVYSDSIEDRSLLGRRSIPRERAHYYQVLRGGYISSRMRIYSVRGGYVDVGCNQPDAYFYKWFESIPERPLS